MLTYDVHLISHPAAGFGYLFLRNIGKINVHQRRFVKPVFPLDEKQILGKPFSLKPSDVMSMQSVDMYALMYRHGSGRLAMVQIAREQIAAALDYEDIFRQSISLEEIRTLLEISS